MAYPDPAEMERLLEEQRRQEMGAGILSQMGEPDLAPAPDLPPPLAPPAPPMNVQQAPPGLKPLAPPGPRPGDMPPSPQAFSGMLPDEGLDTHQPKRFEGMLPERGLDVHHISPLDEDYANVPEQPPPGTGVVGQLAAPQMAPGAPGPGAGAVAQLAGPGAAGAPQGPPPGAPPETDIDRQAGWKTALGDFLPGVFGGWSRRAEGERKYDRSTKTEKRKAGRAKRETARKEAREDKIKLLDWNRGADKRDREKQKFEWTSKEVERVNNLHEEERDSQSEKSINHRDTFIDANPRYMATLPPGALDDLAIGDERTWALHKGAAEWMKKTRHQRRGARSGYGAGFGATLAAVNSAIDGGDYETANKILAASKNSKEAAAIQAAIKVGHQAEALGFDRKNRLDVRNKEIMQRAKNLYVNKMEPVQKMRNVHTSLTAAIENSKQKHGGDIASVGMTGWFHEFVLSKEGREIRSLLKILDEAFKRDQSGAAIAAHEDANFKDLTGMSWLTASSDEDFMQKFELFGRWLAHNEAHLASAHPDAARQVKEDYEKAVQEIDGGGGEGGATAAGGYQLGDVLNYPDGSSRKLTKTGWVEQ